MAQKVQILYGGKPIWPRTSIDNVVDPDTGEPASIGGGGGGGTTPTSVKYASSAGLASGLTTQVKSDIIKSAVSAVPTVTSVISATSAEIAYGLDATLKAAIIASATPAPITSVAEAGLASSVTADVKTDILTSVNITSVASAGTADDIVATVKSDIIDSAVAAVPTVTSVASASVADTLVAAEKSNIINSATSAVDTSYQGPFKCRIVNVNSVTIGTGAMYLGGAESNIAMSTISSATGTVYFFCYHTNNTYIHGVEIASSAAALTSAAIVTGSAGYYVALANITEYGVEQRHFGDIYINGRIQ